MKIGYPAPTAPGRVVGRGVSLPNKVAKPSVRRGRLTLITMEEAQEDPGVILGTLYVNSILASVLQHLIHSYHKNSHKCMVYPLKPCHPP
jgi:hypothetical protein